MPNTMDDWQKATRIETQHYKLLQTGPGMKHFGCHNRTGSVRICSLSLGLPPFLYVILPLHNHVLYYKARMTHDPVLADSRCTACGVILISDSTS